MSAHDAVADFHGAMAEFGLRTSATIAPDGRMRRFHVEGDAKGSKNGWAVLFANPSAGAFGCWKRGLKVSWNGGRDELDTAERNRLETRIREARERRECEDAERGIRAAARASAVWDRASAADPAHAYLAQKGVGGLGLRQIGDRVLVPVRDIAGEFHGLQTIEADGTKRFTTGTSKVGNFHLIGDRPTDRIFVVEGYATGATVHEATSAPVAVAFDAGNLGAVTKALRDGFPAIGIIVAGDNDHATEGNPGRTAAVNAARIVSGLVAIPLLSDDEGTDWNDMAAVHGLDAVKDGLERGEVPEAVGRRVDLAKLEEALARVQESGDLGDLRRAYALVAQYRPDSTEEDHAVERIHVVAKSLGVRKPTIRAEIGRARALASHAHMKDVQANLKAQEPKPEDLLKKGRRILEAEDQLVLLREVLSELGYAGDKAPVEIGYVAFHSRSLDRPLNLAFIGPSASGKTFAQQMAARFHPEDVVHDLTAMSERALAYSEFDTEHAYVVISEASALHQDGIGATIIRELAWGSRLKYEVVEKTPDGLRARVIEKPGPTGLVTTSTRPLDAEIATRVMQIHISDTPAQTKAVVRELAREAEGSMVADPDLSEWVAASKALALDADARVVVPYATDLAEHVPTDDVRMRRDFTQLLTVVRTLAFIHQHHRARDEFGRIVASPADYASAYRLLCQVLAVTLDNVSDAIRETVEAVEAINEGLDEKVAGVSHPALAAHLGMTRSGAWKRAKDALRVGYLANLEERKGHPARLIVGDPLPEPRAVLPDPDELFAIPSDLQETGNTPLESGLSSGKEGISEGVSSHAPSRKQETVGNGLGNTPKPHTYAENSEGVSSLPESSGDAEACAGRRCEYRQPEGLSGNDVEDIEAL